MRRPTSYQDGTRLTLTDKSRLLDRTVQDNQATIMASTVSIRILKSATWSLLLEFTDLFIKRARSLAVVVNLVILIAGLQAIRSLRVRQYPRSDIAVVQVTTVYVGANADLVRGSFITTPLERVIASADGIDYMESSSAQGPQHDHRAPEAQLRHHRGADPDPGEAGPGPQ